MILKRVAKMEAELARLSDLHCELAEQYNRLRDELDAQRGLALAAIGRVAVLEKRLEHD